MIIFGQGAMRCHPYVLAEFEAAQQKDDKQALIAFDKALIGHMGYAISNFIRTIVLSLTSGRIVKAPGEGKVKRYFQQATRFSSAFALLSDVSLLVLGGSLKRRESLSGRLGDILSYLYMISATLKHYQDQGSQKEDLPLLQWACESTFYRIQERFDEVLKNFPNRWMGVALRILIFPFGQMFSKPSDKLGVKVAQLLLSPTESRARLTEGVYVTDVKGNMMSLIEDALIKSIAAEPIEKVIKSAVKDRVLRGGTIDDQAKEAYEQKMISQEQLDIVLEAEKARHKVISVDDFAPEELERHPHKSSTKESYAAAHSTK